MPITIDEKYDSREATVSESSTVELRYVVQGTNDDVLVKAIVAATSPPIYYGLQRDSFVIRPLGGEVWECSVQYVQVASESQFTFETGGGTQHISLSLETIDSYPAPGEVAPDFKGAIGVNQDNVAGTDITIPVFNFSETHYIDDSLVTGAYKATLFFLTGRVNDAPFKGFAKGEVLFMGASGSKRGESSWEITFRFAASPNVTNLTLGKITGIDKEGWHYLWIRFADDTDINSNSLIKKPIAAYVERVYEYGNFAGLGIGT